MLFPSNLDIYLYVSWGRFVCSEVAPFPYCRISESKATTEGIFLLDISSRTILKGAPGATIATLIYSLPKSIPRTAPRLHFINNSSKTDRIIDRELKTDFI